MIKTYIKEGQIVPMEVTIKLLENAMRAAMSSQAGEAKEASATTAIPARRFLIDGFPRQMDQAIKFDESVSRRFFIVIPSLRRVYCSPAQSEVADRLGEEQDLIRES